MATRNRAIAPGRTAEQVIPDDEYEHGRATHSAALRSKMLSSSP